MRASFRVEDVVPGLGRREHGGSQSARASASESNRTQVPSDGRPRRRRTVPGRMISIPARRAPRRIVNAHAPAHPLHLNGASVAVVNSPRVYTPVARPSRRRARVCRRPDPRSRRRARARRPRRRCSCRSTPRCSRRTSGAASARCAAGDRSRWRRQGAPEGGVLRRRSAAGCGRRPTAATTGLPVTDGQIKSSSVGAVAVSESNPDIVYIGMGESCIRGNIMPGDGMYKSTDAGKTWTHIGFGDGTVDAISKIRVHPTNPDIVFVGRRSASTARTATSAASSRRPTAARRGRRCCSATTRPAPSTSRSTGATRTCCTPRCGRRTASSTRCRAADPGSGLFKSTDGGETWTEITRNPGPARRRRRPHRRRRVRRRLEPRLRAGRERARRALHVRQRRRHVDARQREPQRPAARVLLHARHRRSGREGHRLHAERERVTARPTAARR